MIQSCHCTGVTTTLCILAKYGYNVYIVYTVLTSMSFCISPSHKYCGQVRLMYYIALFPGPSLLFHKPGKGPVHNVMHVMSKVDKR